MNSEYTETCTLIITREEGMPFPPQLVIPKDMATYFGFSDNQVITKAEAHTLSLLVDFVNREADVESAMLKGLKWIEELRRK